MGRWKDGRVQYRVKVKVKAKEYLLNGGVGSRA